MGRNLDLTICGLRQGSEGKGSCTLRALFDSAQRKRRELWAFRDIKPFHGNV